jgi:hypothetical protein
MNSRLRAARATITSGPDMPVWWPIVQLCLGAGFVIYLLMSFGSGGDAPDDGALPFGSGSAVTAPVNVAPDAPGAPGAPDAGPVRIDEVVDSAPGTPAVPANGTLEVAGIDGGTFPTPAAAVQVATAAAIAAYSGDYVTVPMLAGTRPPAADYTWPAPAPGPAAVRTISATLLQFRFTVDPDGDGPEVGRVTTVHVVNVDGSWLFRGV